MSTARHGQDPNGAHLRLCGELFNPAVDVETATFVGLLIYGDDYADGLCPACVDSIEFNLRTWRQATGHRYAGPQGAEIRHATPPAPDEPTGVVVTVVEVHGAGRLVRED